MALAAKVGLSVSQKFLIGYSAGAYGEWLCQHQRSKHETNDEAHARPLRERFRT
jgi:hypothetical protein